MPMNTTSAHCTLCRSASRSAAISGRATLTEKSREARNIASPAVAPMRAPRQRPPVSRGPLAAVALTAAKGAARGPGGADWEGIA